MKQVAHHSCDLFCMYEALHNQMAMYNFVCLYRAYNSMLSTSLA